MKNLIGKTLHSYIPYFSEEYKDTFLKPVRCLNSIVYVNYNLLMLPIVMKDTLVVSAFRIFFERTLFLKDTY